MSSVLSNNALERTSSALARATGFAAASPLNAVFYGQACE